MHQALEASRQAQPSQSEVDPHVFPFTDQELVVMQAAHDQLDIERRDQTPAGAEATEIAFGVTLGSRQLVSVEELKTPNDEGKLHASAYIIRTAQVDDSLADKQASFTKESVGAKERQYKFEGALKLPTEHGVFEQRTTAHVQHAALNGEPIVSFSRQAVLAAERLAKADGVQEPEAVEYVAARETKRERAAARLRDMVHHAYRGKHI